MYHMKTTTVRQLRHDFGSVLEWIEDGEEVEISKRGEVVALLKPVQGRRVRQVKRPDFAARLKKLFPKGRIKGKPLAEHLRDERDRY